MLKVFEHWLLLNDYTPILAVLGTAAANMLPGKPVWLGLIGPPSSGKNEILDALSGLPFVARVSTLTAPGLLSGTPRQQQAQGAKGGLLRQVSNPGVIVCKEFSSILNMRPDTRNELLSALREIYDGHWTRYLGTDGGKMLTWSGKVGLLIGATPRIDSLQNVISSTGDRLIFSRIEPVRQGQLRKAIKHRGAAGTQMQNELASAVSKLFAQSRQSFQPLNDQELDRLDHIVSIVVCLRGGIDRDFKTRELETVHAAEGPARIGLALEQLFSGLLTLGLERTKAFQVISAVAMDSTPPSRRCIYGYLRSLKRGASATTSDVAAHAKLPTLAVRRALEELEAYDLIRRVIRGRGRTGMWQAV
jgi:FaeA-like protein